MDVDKIISLGRDIIAEAAERVKADKGPEHDITVGEAVGGTQRLELMESTDWQWRINYNSKTDSRINREDVLTRAREMSDLTVTMKGADIVVGIEIYRVSRIRPRDST